MQKYRVAIIGYGRSGRDIHLNLLKQLPERYEVVAIVDANARRREMIAAEAGVQALADYRELLGRKDIDLVVNASFSSDHYPISAELLSHGLNVLSEKPAAANPAQLDEILSAARKSGTVFQVFQQYRFAPSYQKVKEVIASGVLGRVVQISLCYNGFARRWDWQTVQAMKAGSLLNTGPHPVDQALDLMGFPDDFQVHAFFDRAHTSGDAEDYAKLLLQTKGAPLTEIEISSCNAFPGDTYLVQGTRGTLKGTTGRLDWTYYIDEDEPLRPLIMEPLMGERGEPIYCREQLAMHTDAWEALGEERDDFNYKGLAFYNSLYGFLEKGTPMPVTNDQIRKQLVVIEEAHRQNDERVKPFIDISQSPLST